MRYLSTVEIAAVPLHLIAGPCFQVWTSNEETEQWFIDALISDSNEEIESHLAVEPCWRRAAKQLYRGILLERGYDKVDATKDDNDFTELLIYASVSEAPAQFNAIPTPPPSSSPGAGDYEGNEASQQTSQNIKLFALPLSAQKDEAVIAHALQIPVTYDSLGTAKPFFQPASLIDITTASISNAKRQRISTMFQDATHRRKRLMWHGGKGVSKVMADSCPANFGTFQCLKLDNTRDLHLDNQSIEKGLRPTERSNLSRSSSKRSLQNDEPSRLVPRRDSLNKRQRSSLGREESLASIRGNCSKADENNSVESQNRSSLTRIVLAGMRLYGLQQRKKSAKPQQELGSTMQLFSNEPCIPQDDEDEYKLVYHQTFKTALFTFRNHISQELVNQEVMGDVVDRLLAMFCTNPLLSSDENDTFQAAFNGYDSLASRTFSVPEEYVTKPSAVSPFCVATIEDQEQCKPG